VHGNLANVLATMERCGETIPGLKTAARAACHETVGIAKHNAGKLQDARREFERAVQLAPMNGGFHANYASALLNTGDRPAALQHATRAKALGITDHPIFGPLGMR
jgi:Flp pilus assembly protein TadD